MYSNSISFWAICSTRSFGDDTSIDQLDIDLREGPRTGVRADPRRSEIRYAELLLEILPDRIAGDVTPRQQRVENVEGIHR
jgi:hypothetical protein